MRKFKVPKKYGEYQQKICGFCPKIATTKNEQGLEVCIYHVKQAMDEIKCLCGRWLEIRSGKFGAFFNCINCGNLNYNKAMEIKELTQGQGADGLKIQNAAANSTVATQARQEAKLETVSNAKPEIKVIARPKPRLVTDDDDDDDSRVTTISSRDVDYF